MKRVSFKDFLKNEDVGSKEIISRFNYDQCGLSAYSSVSELLSLGLYLDKVYGTINLSESPRIIILETWLVIDELLKRAILKGLNLDALIHQDLNILPFGYKDKIDLLLKLIRSEIKKPIYPYRDYPYLPSKMSTEMMADKDFFDKFCWLEHNYWKEQGLSQPTFYEPIEKEKYQFVNEEWLDSMTNLPKDWKDKALEINKVRNIASHVIHEEKIYVSLGLNGPKKLKLLKEYCLDTLSQLAGYQFIY